METVQELEAQRNAVLEEMRSIRCMRRGTITEQHYKTHLKGRKGMVLQGPYIMSCPGGKGKKPLVSA